MKLWTQESISSCLHVYLRELDSSASLKMPTERPNKNSDRKSERMFLVNFSKVQQLSNNFSKKRGYIDQKVRTILTADAYRRFFQHKTVFLEKVWLFGMFSEDKGDYIDEWMIRITIQTNQIDMDVCFSALG